MIRSTRTKYRNSFLPPGCQYGGFFSWGKRGREGRAELGPAAVTDAKQRPGFPAPPSGGTRSSESSLEKRRKVGQSLDVRQIFWANRSPRSASGGKGCA